MGKCKAMSTGRSKPILRKAFCGMDSGLRSVLVTGG
jgi:hypothetical protein